MNTHYFKTNSCNKDAGIKKFTITVNVWEVRSIALTLS
jgi:hypothetical protein